MSDGEVVAWITVKGHRVPIMDGESKEDAVKRAFQKDGAKKSAESAKKQESKDGDGGFTSPTSDKFSNDVAEARGACSEDIRWRVDVHEPSEYDEHNARMFTTPGGSTVAVTSKGDIISVCKKPGDSMSGRDLMAQAVRNGGNRLDSFYGNHGFYVRCGFEPVCYTPFNREYAPDGWRSGKDAEEPVVFYRYVGVGNVRAELQSSETALSHIRQFTGDNGYDDAMNYRDRQMR